MAAALGPPVFFPNPLLGWLFLAILLGFALVGAYWDLRTRAIPKWVPLALLALGVVLQVMRGAWLGYDEVQVWALGANGVALGVVDAILFGLTGFAVAFGLFFVMWILRICGGGDVKQFAAIGAWIGPVHALWLLAGSTVVLLIQSVAVLMIGLLVRGPFETLAKHGKQNPQKQNAPRGMTYSLPLAIAVGIMMPWFWRFDLELAPRPSVPISTPSTAQGGG